MSTSSEAAVALPPVAITMGDPNGIGPELILGCLQKTSLRERMVPLVVGSAHVLRVHAKKLGYHGTKIRPVSEVPQTLDSDTVAVLEVAPDREPAVRFGQITPAGGQLAMQSVERAVGLCREQQAAAMVTAPISKKAITEAGYDYPGHTEFIAERTGTDTHTMMMVAVEEQTDPSLHPLRVGLVTGHVSVAQIPDHLTTQAIVDKLRIIHRSLEQDFGDSQPLVAVLGLNPHAGDEGVMGDEEARVIRPAMEQARREGIQVSGPFPADGFFGRAKYRQFGAVLAMYHDQGLVPFKALAFDEGVNFTAGLPIVRTSPDHGTAYDIAGTGQASLGSMQHAIELAVDVATRRKLSV